MIYFLFLLALLPVWAAPKNLDLSYGIQGRSLPGIGAELYAESGYNQLLWGKKEEPKDFLYGLVRPSLGVSSSAVINSLKAELEVFPISILGFSVGRQYINSNYDFPFLECNKVACDGDFQRNWIESKMVLGAGGWVVLGNFKVDVLSTDNKDRPMADWRNIIIGNSGSDVEIEKKLILGKQFDNNMKLAGVLIENVKFQGSGQQRESFAAIYQERRGDTNYMIGAGGLHTHEQPMGFVLYFRIHHIALPSLKLF